MVCCVPCSTAPSKTRCILTGGIAHSQFVVDYVKQMISAFATVVIYPGEDEMEALAMSGLRVLNGEKSKEY